MGIFDKLFNKPKVDKYYQLGLIHSNMKRGSYRYLYDRNMTFSHKVPIEEAKRRYIDCNKDWLFNQYQENLDIDNCLQKITIDNVQIHPKYKHQYNIINNNGYIILRIKKEYR